MDPIRVLFLCAGNACPRPMAAGDIDPTAPPSKCVGLFRDQPVAVVASVGDRALACEP